MFDTDTCLFNSTQPNSVKSLPKLNTSCSSGTSSRHSSECLWIYIKAVIESESFDEPLLSCIVPTQNGRWKWSESSCCFQKKLSGILVRYINSLLCMFPLKPIFLQKVLCSILINLAIVSAVFHDGQPSAILPQLELFATSGLKLTEEEGSWFGMAAFIDYFGLLLTINMLFYL